MKEKGKRAIAAASVRASTGENEVRETKVLFVHQKVMYSLKYNYFLFHIRIEITFMFLFRGLRSELSRSCLRLERCVLVGRGSHFREGGGPDRRRSVSTLTMPRLFD